MKTTTLLLAVCLIFLANNIQGQTYKTKTLFVKNQAKPDMAMVLSNYYTFVLSSGTYTDLTNATSLNNNQLWDDPDYVIPIGFPFKLYNELLDSLYFEEGMGAGLTGPLDTNFGFEHYIATFEADIIDRGDLTGISKSPISYKVEGSSPNRILKVEWKNVGFFDEGDSLGTLNDYISFQLWLYEGSNNIEFHYGPSNIANPLIDYEGETGAYIGLADSALTDVYLLKGSVAAPVLSNTIQAVIGTPANGTIYKFIYNSTISINSGNNPEIKAIFAPNPMQESAMLRFENYTPQDAKLIITDIQGRIVREINHISSTEIWIERKNLQKGVYLYRLIENGRYITQSKFIVY